MNFNEFKDVNKVKAQASELWSDIKAEFKNVKEVNGEKFKSAFSRYFIDYLKNNYVKFDGRVSRREYWMFALFSTLIGIVLNIIFVILPPLALLGLAYSLALLLPSIGLVIRRLHDINLSGWFLLIALIPFIGGIALLLLLVLPGDAEANKFDEHK